MKAIESGLLRSLPGVTHGFGTLAEEVPSALRGRWELTRPRWKQVHGVGVARVCAAGDDCGDVDALWTAEARLPIAVVTADCVPVLLARRDGQRVAAVHAGWRGTRARILRVLWEQLLASGEKPGEWVAAIGPSIGPCCYEVSEELAADFSSEFASFGDSVAVPRARILDLPAINAAELRLMGFFDVDLIRSCTRCSLDPVSGDYVSHSYRREGGGTRQYSMIQVG